MGTTVTAGTDKAKFKRGSTVLECGATVKPCETLGTSWSTSGQYMVEGYGGVSAASGGKCNGVRADNSLISWTMPSTGSGNVGVKITYATGSTWVRQTAACDYTLDTSDTSACGSSSSPTPSPTPSGASPTPAPTPAPSSGSYSAPSAAPAAANGANRSIAGLMTCAALALAASVLALMA